MEQDQYIYLGKEFAKFFVYCCEGAGYVSMIDQFRWAKNRQALIDAMSTLLEHGKTSTHQVAEMITPQKWKRLTDFILQGEFHKVREAHTAMIRYVSAYELEKIRITEAYLTKLLVHYDQGDH